MPHYFRSSTSREADKEASRILTEELHNHSSDVFTGISCCECTFKLQVREGSCLYQTLLRRVAYALQGPLGEELDQLQKQQIIVPLGIDETSKLYNSFMLFPKVSDKVKLCLDLAWLNKVLIKPIHRGLTLSDIISRQVFIMYLTLINAYSGYHNIKLDEQSPYQTTSFVLW